MVLVSNRVAVPGSTKQPGGLAVALREAFRTKRGLWFGWSGHVREDALDNAVRHQSLKTLDIATLDLAPDEYRACYLGYANSSLWPTLHYRTDLLEYRSLHFDSYRRVNARFAKALSPLLDDSDVVWVHDYHLVPFAAELRRLGHGQRVGLFLHIPFPPPEVFSALPRHEELLDCLFEYDVVGVQTQTDARCLRDCLVELAGGRLAAKDCVSAGGRLVRVSAFPIGIDVDEFRSLALRPDAREQASRLIGALDGRDLMIGVDRLDYTKGLKQRFEAYRQLLDGNPARRNAVSLLQVAPLSRQEIEAYAEARDELNRLSSEINGAFAELDWTPIRYFVKPLARSTLAALYRTARVGLVTPLRDGMNLVAKEYIAAQAPDDPGVLVLSRFAGAASELEEALLVNPHDIDETASAIDAALAMPLAERRERHAKLAERLRRHDVHRWCRNYLQALGEEAGEMRDAL